MDREDKILIHILEDAEQRMLSKRKWKVYGCKSEDEMQAILDVLLKMEAITQHTQPHSAATGGRGAKELVTWENDPYYSITSKGKADLERLSSQAP